MPRLFLLLLAACPGRIANPQQFVDVKVAFPCDKTPEQVFTEIVGPKCASSGCHDTMSNAAGVDLQSQDAALRLFGLASRCGNRLLLDDQTPFAGYLFEKVSSAEPACGKPMPYNGTPLTAEEQRCLHQWLWPKEAETAAPTGPTAVVSSPSETPPPPGPTPAPTPAPSGNALCPATPPSQAFVVFDDAVAAGWDAGGFDWARFIPATTTVCSGASSRTYAATQYDGFQFLTDGTPVVAGHLTFRLHASNACVITVAPVPAGETDPHVNQSAEINVQPGWQTITHAVTAANVRWILLEKQDTGSTTFFIDDVWLTD